MVFVTFRQTVVSACHGSKMPRRAAPRVYSAPGVPRFVSYIRVSTDKQGASGLGLDAQRAAVSRHVAAAQGVLVAEFSEIESGKKNDRPEIATALAACRVRHAVLIIAKLDRLARNVLFIATLMESGVDFVACDNPHATPLLIHGASGLTHRFGRPGYALNRPT